MLKLEPMQAQMVADLRRKIGAERARTYVTQQRTAHRQALAMHCGCAQGGTAAPAIQHHIEMLRGS